MHAKNAIGAGSLIGTQPYGVVAADLDGDGDDDVVAGTSAADTIALLENVTPTSTSWSFSYLINGEADSLKTVLTADINSDGQLDVIYVSSNDGEIGWLNNSGGVFTRTLVSEGEVSAPYGLSPADVDGDGDIDLFTGARSSQEVTWWENTQGDGSAWTEHQIMTGAVEVEQVWAADMDRDGDSDVMLTAGTSGDPFTVWLENPGDKVSAWTSHDIPVEAGAGGTVSTAADLDGDGDVDVLTASFFGNQDFRWHENTDGVGDTWVLHTIDDTRSTPFMAMAADADGDGDLDVFATSVNDDSVLVYENLTIHRSATYPTKAEVADGFSTIEDVALGDIDYDGRLDVVSASSGDGRIAWYGNSDVKGVGWTGSTISTGASIAVSVDVGDIDNDGAADVVSATRTAGGLIQWYQNVDGLGGSWQAKTVTSSFELANFVKLADMNRDGLLDVVATARVVDAVIGNGEIAWFENPGAGSTWTKHSAGLNLLSAGAAAGDIDGDGDMDIASAAAGAISGVNAISFHRNTDSDGGGTTWSVVAVGDMDGASSVDVGDFDQDGDLDIIASGSGGNSVSCYINTAGDGSSWTTHEVSTSVAGAERSVAADVDNDGDLDIVTAGEGVDAVIWHENANGLGTSWTLHTEYSEADSAPVSFAVGDVDRDGDLDVVGALQGTGSAAWFFNGGGQFALPTTSTAPSTILPGVTEDVLKVVVTHQGRSGDADLEWATIDLLFEENDGDPLTTSEANSVVESLLIYLDDGSGTFEMGSDTLVLTVDTLALTDGEQTVTFVDSDTNVQVAQGTPQTYFVVLAMDAGAGAVPINGIRLTHQTESSSTAQERTNDLPLTLEYLPDVASILVDTGAPPVVLSAGPSGANPSNAGTVSYAVEFTKSVTGVDETDFAVTAVGPTGASVTGVSGSGASYIATVNSGTGDGTLRLDVVDNDTIVDSFNKPLGGFGTGNGNFTGVGEHTIDKTPPDVSVSAPSSSATTGGPVTYTITYTDADSVTLTESAVTLVKDGTANGLLTVSGSGVAERTVTIDDIEGDGTLGISIDGGTAFDTVGNASESASGTAFTVDNTAPSISISAPSLSDTSSGPVDFVITYTGAVSGGVNLSGSDVQVIRTGTAQEGLKFIFEAGTEFDPTVRLEDLTGDGTLSIRINADTAVDALGNSAAQTSASATVSVDNTDPTAPTITTDGGNGPGANYSTFLEGVTLEGTVDPTASELLVNGSSSGVTYSPGASAWSFDTILSLASDVGINAFTVLARDAAGNESPETSLEINLLPPSTDVFVDADSGSDLRGDGTAGDPWNSIQFAIDRVAPFASLASPITVRLENGLYNERVTMAPHTRLIGSDRSGTIIRWFDITEDDHVVVTAAENSRVDNLTITQPAGTLDDTFLVQIDDVEAHLTRVVLDGASNGDSTGVIISGAGSSDSTIQRCTIRALTNGVHAIGSGVKIRGNFFEFINNGNAIFIAFTDTGNGSAAVAPRLGDGLDISQTGFNRFRNIDGFFINIDEVSPVTTVAEYNDWGLADTAAILARISIPSAKKGAGPDIDIEPHFKSGALGPGTLVVLPFVDGAVGGDGKPLAICIEANPAVRMLSAGIDGVMDNGTGSFVFAAAPAGTDTVEISAAGFETVNENVDIEGLVINDVVAEVAGDGCDAFLPPALVVSPGTVDLGSGSGSTDINVSNGGGGLLDWSAAVTEGGDWLSVSAAKVVGNGTITATFSANGGAERHGMIAVTASGVGNSPVNILVTQAGDGGGGGGDGGDVNGDDVTDAIDIQLVINGVLGLTGDFPTDVNDDGMTDAVDIQLVINEVLGV
jgi:hypothetical protein